MSSAINKVDVSMAHMVEEALKAHIMAKVQGLNACLIQCYKVDIMLEASSPFFTVGIVNYCSILLNFTPVGAPF